MRIILENIKIFAYHGVMAQEKTVGNWYTINVRLNVSDESSTRSDNLDDTVSYAEVYETVRREMEIRSRLIEHVCGRICRAVLSQCKLVDEVTVSILKANPPIGAECSGCGVELTLKR